MKKTSLSLSSFLCDSSRSGRGLGAWDSMTYCRSDESTNRLWSYRILKKKQPHQPPCSWLLNYVFVTIFMYHGGIQVQCFIFQWQKAQTSLKTRRRPVCAINFSSWLGQWRWMDGSALLQPQRTEQDWCRESTAIWRFVQLYLTLFI